MGQIGKHLIAALIGAAIVVYFVIGAVTALIAAVVSGSANSPDVWWANATVCLFAWPIVWVAAIVIALMNQ